jgi:hypothetical protein
VPAPASYQPRVAFTIQTTDNMMGTSTSTPTTVASAARNGAKDFGWQQHWRLGLAAERTGKVIAL